MALNTIVGKLNKENILTDYKGVTTPSAIVTVDNTRRTIKVDLNSATAISPSTIDQSGGVVYGKYQNLTDIQQQVALDNINAQKRLEAVIEPGHYNKIQVNKYGLVEGGTNELITLSDLNLNNIDKRYIRLSSQYPQNIESSFIIKGNLRVNGSIVSLNDEGTSEEPTLKTNKDLILLRYDKQEGLLDNEFTGLASYNYNGNQSTGYLVFDNKGIARLGENTTSSPLRPLAVRDEVELMTNNKFVYWDSNTWALKTRNIKVEDLDIVPNYYPEELNDLTTKEYVDEVTFKNSTYRVFETLDELNTLEGVEGLRVFIKEEALIDG